MLEPHAYGPQRPTPTAAPARFPKSKRLSVIRAIVPSKSDQENLARDGYYVEDIDETVARPRFARRRVGWLADTSS